MVTTTTLLADLPPPHPRRLPSFPNPPFSLFRVWTESTLDRRRGAKLGSSIVLLPPLPMPGGHGHFQAPYKRELDGLSRSSNPKSFRALPPVPFVDRMPELSFGFDVPVRAQCVSSEQTEAKLAEFRQLEWIRPDYQQATLEGLGVVETYWRRYVALRPSIRTRCPPRLSSSRSCTLQHPLAQSVAFLSSRPTPPRP